MKTPVNVQPEILRYENLLRPFAFNLTRNKEETEDLLQDTFYKALANKDKFNEGTNIKAWLFTIMRNTFINNYRRQKKSNILSDSSQDQYLLNSTTKTVSNGSEDNLLGEQISKVMQRVGKDLTEPFMMHYSGFQYQEISEKLELPLGTVKSRIFIARKRLQEGLNELGLTSTD